MRLPDFTNHEGLLALRRLMGADAPGSFSPSYRPDQLTLAELEQLATDGKDVSIDDVVVLEDNTLSYKDSRVLVYIRDVIGFQPRFHVAYCDKLQQMRQANRFSRYVVTTRNDGMFLVNRVDNSNQIVSNVELLRVCQFCLAKLAFDDFSIALSRSEKKKIVLSFTILRFFAKFPRSLFHALPTGNAATAPLNVYPEDFADISKRVREQHSWRCERCRRDFSGVTDREYLHVHHRNGMKNENHDENLQVLCLGCHAGEPLHGHLKNLSEYPEFVRRFGQCR